jgi:group I intron endonuclease
MGFIYKITNTITKKCYIGETTEKDPNSRFKAHMNGIRRGKGCPALRDAVQKHGEENFKFEVLIICLDEDCYTFEKDYIKKYNSIAPNGYNILEGGQCGGGFKGKIHTEETKKQIGKMSKQYYADPEILRTHSERLKKKFENPENRKIASDIVKNSEKFKQAVAEGRVGGAGHHSLPREEVKKKISEGLKKYYENGGKSDETINKHREAITKAKGRSISQFNLDGTFVATYKSVREAGRALKRPSGGSIPSTLSGRTKQAYGFIWKYATANT